MNWGKLASQRMIPSMVIDMFLKNGIYHVKLFSPSMNVLQAFARTNIELSVAISNDELKRYKTVEDVRHFLRERVLPPIQNDVKIRYIQYAP